MNVQTVHPACSVMEAHLSRPVVTAGRVISAEEGQSIQLLKMALLEGTVHQDIIVREKHQNLFHVRYVLVEA